MNIEILPIILLFAICCSVIPIMLIVFGEIRTSRIWKQKKTFNSTVIYENQVLSIKGEAQREPLRDADSSFGECAIFKFDFYYCNKISLIVKNEDSLPIDTDVSREPLAITLGVKGKLGNIAYRDGVRLLKRDVRLLEVNPAKSKLELSTRDGLLLLERVHLEPFESLKIVFLGYFTVGWYEL